MRLFLLQRALALVVTAVLVALITFALLHLTPGDPAQVAAGADATPDQVAATRTRLGLDAPLPVQLLNWVTGLLHGDLGTSYAQSRPVLDMILERLSVTAWLVVAALVVALLIALPAGVLAALTRGRAVDRTIVVGTSLGIALPDFFVGLVLVLVFALTIPLFPATGYVPFADDPGQWALSLVLPALTLGVAVAAELTRHVRASLGDVLDADYVRTARAKGLGGRSVVLKHALRNGSVPVLTVLGVQVARLLGGTVIVEQVFNLPGIGQLAVQSVFARDLPVVLGLGIVTAVLVLLVNVVVDLGYGWLNPRIRT